MIVRIALSLKTCIFHDQHQDDHPEAENGSRLLYFLEGLPTCFYIIKNEILPTHRVEEDADDQWLDVIVNCDVITNYDVITNHQLFLEWD